MKNNQKFDMSNLQGKPDKLIWFDEAKVSAIIDAVKKFIERKSHYLVVRRAMTESVADYLTREYIKKIESYRDVIKRSYIKSNGAVYAILRCIGSCVADALEHQDKILRVGEALAVFDANIDAVLSGSERIMDYSQISETRRKEQQVTEDVTSKKTVDFAEALESGDMGDIEKAIAESVKQKELLEKTREEAQKNQQALDIAQTNLENSKNQVSEGDMYNRQAESSVVDNANVSTAPQEFNMQYTSQQSQPQAQSTMQNAQNVEQGQTSVQQPMQQQSPVYTNIQPEMAQSQVAPNQYVQPQVSQNPVVQPGMQQQAPVSTMQQTGTSMVQQTGQYVQTQEQPTMQNTQNVAQGQTSVQQQVQQQSPVYTNIQPEMTQSQVAPNQYVQPQVAQNPVVQPNETQSDNTNK